MSYQISVVGPYPDPNMKQMVTDLNTILSNVVTLVNDIRAKLKGDYVVSKVGLAMGTTKTKVAHNEVDFLISGAQYTVTGESAGFDISSGGTVPQNKIGAFRLETGTDLAIDLIEADDNATGYDTSGEALAGLADLSDNHVSLGTFCVSHTDGGGFVPGTTNFDDAGVSVTWADGTTVFEAIGDAIS